MKEFNKSQFILLLHSRIMPLSQTSISVIATLLISLKLLDRFPSRPSSAADTEVPAGLRHTKRQRNLIENCSKIVCSKQTDKSKYTIRQSMQDCWTISTSLEKRKWTMRNRTYKQTTTDRQAISCIATEIEITTSGMSVIWVHSYIKKLHLRLGLR